MRILLIGANGQVGWELRRALQPLGEVIPAARAPAPEIRQVELSEPDSIRSLIRQTRPALVINAAAYTAVDRAEAEPALARAVNGTAVAVMAEEVKACNAGLIHYSTDYVFDGRSTTPYRESDNPNPLSAYGRSKLQGERAIAAAAGAHLIIRTSWVYGARGRNFLRTITRLAKEKAAIRVVKDQVGAPTWSRLIADATAQIVAQGRSGILGFLRERGGIYHMSCAGRATWFDFASEIISTMKARGDQAVGEAVPIATGEYPQAAQRPAWSLLDNTRLADTFGLRLPEWREGLKLVFEEFERQ